MRESNFSNAAQNKACVCISAAVYDRRAIDCTATLPLINSLNHLAYLTSTSPRIREMVTLDGGLERLIRILRQVPKSPSASSLRTGTTKEMQAVWKWSLAFQCVVNIGVRGSESVRTRVVEAGMVPVTVRVLEGYLRSSEATRAEERRKEHREHRGQREARREEGREQRERESAISSLARSVARRGAVSAAPAPDSQPIVAAPVTSTGTTAAASARTAASARVPAATVTVVPTPTTADSFVRSNGLSAMRGVESGTRPITPAEAEADAAEVMLDATSRSYMQASSSRPHRSARRRESPSEPATGPRHRSGAVAMPILPDLTVMPMDSDDAASLHVGVSPSTSASSTVPAASDTVRSVSPADVTGGATRSGTLTNVSSIEDFGASGSGSEGLDGSELFAADEGEDSEMDGVVGATASPDAAAAEEVEERQTPRPTRRALAPLSTSEHTPRGIPAWNANAAEASTPAFGAVPTERQDTVVAAQSSNSNRTPSASAATPREARSQLWPGREQQAPSRTHGRHAPAALASMPTVVPPTPTTATPSTPAAATGGEMIYREEEVLLSLQLLAYLSKYSHVRVLFHSSELSGQSLSGSLAELTDLMYPGSSSLSSPASVQQPQQPQRSWDPTLPPKKNVFSIAERYTHKSSRPGSSQASVHLKLAPEIQYWAGVIMRNACRKDEARGGIRQCANMLCGKWESFPREFAKCRRCRKAEYCSKQCQSKGWSLGHRFWCSSRVDETEKDKPSTSEANEVVVEGTAARDAAAALAPPEGAIAAGGERNALEHAATQARAHRLHHHRPTQTTAQATSNASATASGSRTRDRSSTATASTSRRSRPSAIPEHVSANASPAGSRPVSRGSSGGEASDVSDEEMERASRRVAASTLAMPEGSPLALHAALAAEDLEGNAPPPPPQRTDLAGRPLPPPVIAQHDTTAVDAELLSLGGRYTPGANDANDAAAVFGRGDFDQMIWRGHTPVPRDDEDDEASSIQQQQYALEETEQATPPQPQPGPSALRAPIARQAHRFASVAVGTAGGSGDLSVSLRHGPVGGSSSSGALPTSSAGLGFSAHMAAHPYGGLEGRRAPSHHATSFMPRSTSGLASAPAFSQSFPSLVQQSMSMADPAPVPSSSSSSSAYPMDDDVGAHAFSMDDDEDESMCEAHDTEHTHDYEALLRSAASLDQEGEGSFLLPDDVVEHYESAFVLPEEVMLQLVYLYIYLYVLSQTFPDHLFASPAAGMPFDEETFDEAEFVDASAEADLMDFEMR